MTSNVRTNGQPNKLDINNQKCDNIEAQTKQESEPTTHINKPTDGGQINKLANN